MKKPIRMTHILGYKNRVIHPLMPFGIEDTKLGKKKETKRINIEFFKELLVEVKKYDIWNQERYNTDDYKKQF